MPRHGKKSIAAKTSWAARKNLTKLSNIPKDNVEEKHDNITPVVEPLVQSGQNNTQSNVEEQQNVEGVIGLSNDDLVQKGCIDSQSIVEEQHNIEVVIDHSNDDLVQKLVPPSVTSVQASKNQNDYSFPDVSRNRQCTCMALTFLAYHSEGLELKKEDLDKILDKGDSLYQRTIAQLKRDNMFCGYYLSMEQTPNNVETENNKYSVIKSQVYMGYLRAEGEAHKRSWWLKLEDRLKFLSEDVKYALLTVTPYTIAVFRDGSGRYGLFDSHSRSADGLPLPDWQGGRAVMMMFTQLNDLVAKIMQLNVSLYTTGDIDKKRYDFMTVTFEQTNTMPVLLPSMQVNPRNLQQIQSVDLTAKDVMPGGATDTDTSLSEGRKVSSQALSKLNKIQRKRMRAKMVAQLNKSSTDSPMVMRPEYMQKYMAMRKMTDKNFKLKQQLHKKAYNIKNSKNVVYKEKQKSYLFKKYHEDVEFRNKKKAYDNRKYHSDETFRQKRKAYDSIKYHSDEMFRRQRKAYDSMKYHSDETFRRQRKAYDSIKYHSDETFRSQRKAYDSRKYHHDEVFKVKRKAYSKAYSSKRFHEDEEFRERVKKHMKVYMAHKWNTDPFLKMCHDIRTALKIKSRYSEIIQLHRKVRTKVAQMEANAKTAKDKKAAAAEKKRQLIDEAIANFQKLIKEGPTFVCTTCHRALFPDQVNKCNRSDFRKKPAVIALCLTGEYVHSCDNECGGPEQCSVPDERRTEWICKTCCKHVLAGRMPDLAVANNLRLTPIPLELRDHNVLERNVTALVIPFNKILTLPKGKQRAIHGAVVCVPSNVESTVNALPRMLHTSGLYKVKLKRRMQYKSHHLCHTINMRKVVNGLRKLKEIHPEYKDITIREDDSVYDAGVGALIEQLPTVEQTLQDEFMATCDDHEMVQVANSTEGILEMPTGGHMDTCNDEEMLQVANVTEAAESSQSTKLQVTDVTEAVESSQLANQHPPTVEDEQDVLRPGHGLDSCLQPDNIAQEILTFGDGIFTIAPAEGNRPVSYTTVPNLEAKAFPTLYPTGENTLDRERPVKLSPHRYFLGRLESADGRFASNQEFLFYAQYVTEAHTARSAMSVHTRKAKTFGRGGGKITKKTLSDKLELDKLLKKRHATRFMSPMRGTPAYWQTSMYDLFAMVRQLGAPTFFLTLSAAEFRWPEVITAIKAQQGQKVDFDKLDWNEKCNILRSNAVTTMRLFDKRVQHFYSKLLHSKAQPLGKLIDWFHRIEYQARGSPHVHALLWIEGAPVLGEDSDEDICKFADRYISCKLPDPNDDPVLYEIVLQVQMHSKNHTKSCKKGKKTCRFGFPRPPVNKTWITNPAPIDPIKEAMAENENAANQHVNDSGTSTKDAGKKATKGVDKSLSARAQAALNKLKPLFDMLIDSPEEVANLSDLLAKCNMTQEEYDGYLEDMKSTRVLLMQRGVKDCFVNNYNPTLLKAWNANMDIQFVLDHYICIGYMLSYISKAEHEMGNLLNEVVTGIDPTKVSEQDAMNQLVHTYIKNRQVSAQEAAARVCGLHLKECSRKAVFLQTDDNPIRMSLPLSQLQNKSDDSEDVWMKGIPEKYDHRPKSAEFDNMCLAEFGSEYRVVYGAEAKAKNAIKLSDNMGTIMKRTKRCAIIRFPKFSEHKEPEKYYGNLLRLYVPHRYKSSLKTENYPTYKDFYESACVKLPGTDVLQPVIAIVAQNREKYEKHSQVVEEAIQEFYDKGPLEDAWAHLAPESELERMECLAEQEESPDADHERDNAPEFSPSEVCHTTHHVSMPEMRPDYLRTLCRNLNKTQASIFYTVRDWCYQTVNFQNPEPFHLFVTGGAGTGKSHLINCIYGEASRILSQLPGLYEDTNASMPTVLLAAPTGVAAYNINGNTVHSLLKFQYNLHNSYEYLGNKLDDMRAKLGNAKIIIIDEVSMVSKSAFDHVEWRLQEITGSRKPFGGLSVLAVGDFYQLAPVGSLPLCISEEKETNNFNQHFQMIALTEIMRQKDDMLYATLLNKLREKEEDKALDASDRDLLEQRVTDRDNCPKDVLHIFSKNFEVDEHNHKCLWEFHSHIVDIPAQDFRRVKGESKMTRLDRPCRGNVLKDLPDSLQLAEGAPVMILRNIDVEDGLVNGTCGKIDKLEVDDKDGSTVTKLWLILDKPEAGKNYRKTPNSPQVYVERMEQILSNQTVTRKQFPIRLAYACTAHKVQGLTIQSAVVSLKEVFTKGQAYVALSRTTTLQGLHIIDFDEKKIYCNPAIKKALECMKSASLDSVMPLLQFHQKTGQVQSSLTVVHHNTQNLPAHIQDIKSHHELTLADVICLTETHLTGSVAPSLQLDGYIMFTRHKNQSYESISERAEQSGGGVAVYVKEHFKAIERRAIHNVTNLEFVVVHIQAPVELVIAAIYRPPRYDEPFFSNLKNLLNALEIMDHHPIIVCGDFNEDLLSTQRKPIAEELNSRGYAQLITKATTDKGTLLDHMYISRAQHCLQSGVLHTYYSYHEPVYCVLSTNNSES